MRQEKISRWAYGMMVAVSIYGVVWTVEYLWRLYRNVFSQDWATWPIVRDDLLMGTEHYVSAALFYLPVIFVAMATVFSALILLNYYRKGVIFDERPAQALRWLGLSFIGIMLVDTYVFAFERWFYTLWNPEHREPIRYVYDAGDITIAFAGLGFWMIGWITREGVRMREENEGFI